VFQDAASLAQLLVILILGGLISFLLVMAEVKLVKISSSLTMSMFGAVKEVCGLSTFSEWEGFLFQS
jgi:hypothetical protein